MKNSDNPFEDFNKKNEGLKSFHETFLEEFKNQYVEIYIGDQYESLDYADNTQTVNGVLYGKILELYDRFVLLDCFYVDQGTKQIKSGNRVFINTFQIKAITQMNADGTLGDIFLSVRDASKIKKLLKKLDK